MRSDITVVQETAARGARSAAANLTRRRLHFKSPPQRLAAAADCGGEIGGGCGRFAQEPGGDRRQRGLRKRAGGEAGREGEGGAAQPLFDHVREKLGDARAEPSGERVASAGALLPEMGEGRRQRRGVAAAGGGVGERGEGPLQRFEEERVGAAVMFVEGRSADIGFGDDLGHTWPGAAPGGEKEAVVGAEKGAGGSPGAAVETLFPGQSTLPVR